MLGEGTDRSAAKLKGSFHLTNITFNVEFSVHWLHGAVAILLGSVRHIIVSSFTTQKLAASHSIPLRLAPSVSCSWPPSPPVGKAIVGGGLRVNQLLLANIFAPAWSLSVCGAMRLRN